MRRFSFQRIFFYLILFIFPFGQLVSFQLPFFPPSVRIHPLDIAGFIFVLFWLVFRNKRALPFFFKPMLIFLIIAGISLIIKSFSLGFLDFLPAFFYLLRITCWFLFTWAMVDFLKKFRFDIGKLLTFEVTIIALFSLGQYLLLPDMRFLYYSGWDDHLFRAVGSFLDPAFNGIILVLGLIVILNRLLFSSNKKNWLRMFLTVCLLIVCIGLTFSRMSYLLLFLSLILIIGNKKNWRMFFAILITFVILVSVLPKPTGEGVDLLRKSSGFAKIENYQQILSIIRENFWLGVGFNALRTESFRRGFLSPQNWQITHSGAGADNSFLFVLATSGVFGLLAYLYIWFSLLKKVNLKKLRDWGMNKNIYLTTNICLIISAFFVNSLFYPWILCWWGIILANFTAESDN